MNTTEAYLPFGELNMGRIDDLARALNPIGLSVEVKGERPTIALLIEAACLVGLRDPGAITRVATELCAME